MTVRNWWHEVLGERIQFITPDGLIYDLHEPPRKWVLYAEGWGFPPIAAETTSGPFQNGDTLLGVRLRPRRVSLVVRFQGCNRDDYWALRHEFNNMLRVNRSQLNNTKTGTLRRILSNDQVRDLDCILTSGPIYAPRQDGWDEFAFQETLEFTAFNPIIYDPQLRAVTLSDFWYDPGRIDLQYEMTFPFVFCDLNNVITKSVDIQYAGNWQSFPTIKVSGPFTMFSITNVQTGYSIRVDYPLQSGLSMTIQLEYGNKTIFTNMGQSLLNYVSNISTMGLFAIEPEPIVPNGTNTFSVSIAGGDMNTSVAIEYYDRYKAI